MAYSEAASASEYTTKPGAALLLQELILAPLTASWVGYAMPSPQMPANWVIIIAAGLLVGFGSRLGGGCTSGHGICGIARLSARSIAATAIFMFMAIVVVAVTRHLLAG